MDAVRIPDGITSIDMRAKGLQRVPDQVWAAATDMQNLDLSHNALCMLAPGQLTACTALQVWQKPPCCHSILFAALIMEKSLLMWVLFAFRGMS